MSMCLSVLRNKFFLLGSLTYFLPSLVVFGYFLAVVPRNGGGYYSDSTDYSPLFDLVFGITMLVLLVVGLPLLLFVPYWFIMIPYFAFSYGLLYLYWKRFKQKNPKRQTDERLAG
jgi:hypothetical protein